jgi:valyl-tRNA synthetase
MVWQSCNKRLNEDNFEKYRISDALMGIYKLVWDDFCSWFLEMINQHNSQLIA